MSAHEIIIDPEFEALIPPLTEFERDKLRTSIIAYGCRDPLVVWEEENILLDGHNRYRICKELDWEFKVERISKSSRQVAKNWMILNQLARRNLSPDAASILRGKIYLGQKKEHGAPVGNTNNNVKSQSGQIDHSEKTEETIAKQTGVSPRTVRRDAAFAEAAEEKGLTADVIAGKVKRREVMGKVDVHREWDWDRSLSLFTKYVYKHLADVPATDKAEYRKAALEVLEGAR